ncbi:MAG: TraC family protein [Patescibacteria group bacterium]|jgi:type IV secretory pathway VirB4 component
MPTAPAKPGQATKRYLDIAEIRDDTVIMKDGTLRAVLMVSSINFALKSVDEQEAIVQAYMSFLNGLETPLQIVIQSRKMNIDPYLLSLAKRERDISNELLKTQIADYRGFVQELVEMGEIMQKRFYVVVVFDPARSKRKNFWTRFSEAVSPALGIKLKEKQFLERKEELLKKAESINGQLTSLGVGGVLLDTQGLIELFYECYNPDVFAEEKLGDISKVRHEETPTV